MSPESCVAVREDGGEALDRGTCGLGYGAAKSASSGRRRSHNKRKAMSAAAFSASRRGALRGLRTWARTDISMHENREVPRSPAGVDDAPSWMVRGVACRRLAGREGNAEAVIPR